MPPVNVAVEKSKSLITSLHLLSPI